MNKLKFTFGNKELNVERFLTFYLIKPIFIAFLYFGLYSRMVAPFGLTGGMTAVILSAALFFLSVFHLVFFSGDIRISKLTALTLLFYIFIGLTPLAASFLFVGRPEVSFLFSTEVVASFFMLFSTFYLIRSRIITPKFLLYSIAILGTIASFQLLITLIGRARVGRLSGLGSVNYIASSFSISSLIWIMIIYRDYMKSVKLRRHFFNLLGFLAVFLTVILTGTRSAYLAFFVSLFFLQFLGMQSNKFNKYAIVIVAFAVLAIFLIASYIDFSSLWNRFTYDDVYEMALIRFDRYSRAVMDLSLVEYLFGRPDLYTFPEGQIGGHRFVNTHNIFLSLIRYNGIFSFIIFVFILLIILYKYSIIYVKNKNNARLRLTESSIVVLLIAVMIYAIFSGGRSTRIFSLYVILGFILGYFELLKRVRSLEDYKKIIL